MAKECSSSVKEEGFALVLMCTILICEKKNKTKTKTMLSAGYPGLLNLRSILSFSSAEDFLDDPNRTVRFCH